MSSISATSRAAPRLLVGSAAAWLVVAALSRVRIHLGVGLGSEEPVRWLLLGVAGDLVVAGAVVALALAGAPLRRARSILGITLLALLTLAQLGWSEFAIYFGQPVQAENLRFGLHPRVLLGSAQGEVLLFVLIGSAVFVALTLVTALVLKGRYRETSRSAAWALVPLVIGAVLLHPLRETHRAELAQNAALLGASLARRTTVADSGSEVAIVRSGRPRQAARRLLPRDGRQPASEEFPLAWMPPAGGARLLSPLATKPNVVIVLLEGIRTREVAAFGGSPEKLMPNLNRLARQGIRFDAMYSTGTFTPEGEIAAWYGLLASPYELLVRSRPDVKLSGLPEILRSAGWRDMLWIHPGDQSLYLSSRFYEHRGFRVTDGRDFPSSGALTDWGRSDRALFHYAISLLDRAHVPFAAMILTVSNHHPYQVPSDADRIYEPDPDERAAMKMNQRVGQFAGHHVTSMHRTIHYTDQALGAFFDQARTKPWFKNTLFVILGDHGSPVPPLEGISSEHQLSELRHRIPAFLYSPLIDQERTIEGPSSQIDLLPTILGLVGAPPPYPGPGVDLLATGSDPQRPIISWVLNGYRLTVIRGKLAYHATATLADEMEGWSLRDEMVVDRENARAGEGADEELGRFRADAIAFLEDYQEVVVDGRSGIPSVGLKTDTTRDRREEPHRLRTTGQLQLFSALRQKGRG